MGCDTTIFTSFPNRISFFASPCLLAEPSAEVFSCRVLVADLFLPKQLKTPTASLLSVPAEWYCGCMVAPEEEGLLFSARTLLDLGEAASSFSNGWWSSIADIIGVLVLGKVMVFTELRRWLEVSRVVVVMLRLLGLLLLLLIFFREGL